MKILKTFFFYITISFSNDLPTISVSSIQTGSRSVSITLLKELRQTIENEINTMENYQVIVREENEIEEIFSELRMTETLCADIECSKKIGNILGADYLFQTYFGWSSNGKNATILLVVGLV